MLLCKYYYWLAEKMSICYLLFGEMNFGFSLYTMSLIRYFTSLLETLVGANRATRIVATLGVIESFDF